MVRVAPCSPWVVSTKRSPMVWVPGARDGRLRVAGWPFIGWKFPVGLPSTTASTTDPAGPLKVICFTLPTVSNDMTVGIRRWMGAVGAVVVEVRVLRDWYAVTCTVPLGPEVASGVADQVPALLTVVAATSWPSTNR